MKSFYLMFIKPGLISEFSLAKRLQIII